MSTSAPPRGAHHPEDLASSAKVAVLGATRKDEIFGGGSALGRTLSIGGSTYTWWGDGAQGVLLEQGQRQLPEWMNRFIFVPVTTMLNRLSGDRTDQKVAYINVQARSVEEMGKSMQEVTTILRRLTAG